MILIKAPYDDKNLMTDFLIDDFGGINNDKNVWLMFIEGQPVMCTVIDNRLHFRVLGGDKNRVHNYLKQYFSEHVDEIRHEIKIEASSNEIIVKSYFITY